MKKNKGMIIGFLAPAVLIFLVVFLYPIVRTVFMSFFKIATVTDPFASWEFVGLANYSKLFNTHVFILAMKNILKIWMIGGLIVMSISLLFGVILTSGIRGKKFFRAVIYLPNIVSAVALATMWRQYVFAQDYGLFAKFFKLIGAGSFLQNAMACTGKCIYGIADCILLWYDRISYVNLDEWYWYERISPDFYEAATIDGANKIQQFRYMTLPLLKGVFKTNITMWTVTTSAFFVSSADVLIRNSEQSNDCSGTVYVYTDFWCG